MIFKRYDKLLQKKLMFFENYNWFNLLLIIVGQIIRDMTIEDGKKKSGLSLFAKHAVQFYIVGATGVIVN